MKMPMRESERTLSAADVKPPATQVGILGWIRTNLFNGWFISFLTLLTVLFLTPSDRTSGPRQIAYDRPGLDRCRLHQPHPIDNCLGDPPNEFVGNVEFDSHYANSYLQSLVAL